MDDETQKVISVIKKVLRGVNKKIPDKISGKTSFRNELILDSLDWAEIIVRLEEEIGFEIWSDFLRMEIETISDLAEICRVQ